MNLHNGTRGITKGNFPFVVKLVYNDGKPTRYALIDIEIKRPGNTDYHMMACVDRNGRWCHDAVNTEFDIATLFA